MLFQIKSFLKFLSKSTNQHGVHSPFVFDLTTKCFYTKTTSHIKDKISIYRKELDSNTCIISVTDFGKGSRVFKSNKRAVNKIAKVAGISKKRSELLIRFTEYFKPKNILEIGTSLGIGTASLALGKNNANIISLEGCPSTANVAIQQLKKHNFHNVEVKIGDFKNTLKDTLNQKNFDLIYFDGNHQKEPTILYFEECLGNVHNESVFIFDDIHWSEEMQEAWEYIKNHPKVTVTIDSYFWGFVFFRKEQVKEHFVIRI
ncbi:O-methyltransferase [Urechidicola vernalis]|uniref:Class I SAM-dependent methyltransferase n=1 Tax=Urechidicola vernalis TaxID=3075600 RepID=A0ABU2Y291_9FLAO|nr:class I SAM-dependent methyltransferase [Urechidicola sp. P050]MDT0552323.1 class I SAM-dependent methyltransferase [Urechidicola sp. P050]